MTDIEFENMERTVTNLLKVKDGMADGLYEVHKAFIKAGFTKGESLSLIMVLLVPSIKIGDVK